MIRLKQFTGLAFLIVLLGLGGGWAGAAEITLHYAGNMPLGHHVTRGQELFAKLVGEKTKGQVKVLVYPAAQLFADKDLMKAVPSGAVDMAKATLSQWTGMIPALLILDLPLFFNDPNHIRRTVDGEAVEILKRELSKTGVKLLHWMDYGFMEITSKKPIRTLEDFKGRRIRGYGELQTEAIQALGAAPTFLGGGEVYIALQRGTVDGAISGPTSFWERKYYEVTKNVTVCHFTFFTYGVVINLKKWDEIPPDFQSAILSSAAEVQAWSRSESEKEDKRCLEALKEKGMEIYYLPPNERERWKKTCEPVFNILPKRAGEIGKNLVELALKSR